MSTTQIDDLPDSILVEILVRFPCKKFKYVSKRWLGLLSDSYFISRFLSLQGIDEVYPSIVPGLVVVVPSGEQKLRLELLTHPVVKAKAKYLSLDFLPCFQEEKEGESQLIVVGTYNDLVLCCTTRHNQRYYYICNPYTRQWVALPPTHTHHRVHEDLNTRVGFICEPYLNYSVDGKEEQTSSTSTANSITLNAEYRWKVMQIVFPTSSNPDEIHVKVFSSESEREWKELVVKCPRIMYTYCRSRVVAYHGKLYWVFGKKYSTVEFDPTFSSTTTTAGGDIIDAYRFIEGPKIGRVWDEYMCLGVCRGRLRMCPLELVTDMDCCPGLSIWELKEEVDNNGGSLRKWCLIVDGVHMDKMVCKDPLISIHKLGGQRFRVLGFHSNNEDMVYLNVFDNPRYIVMCNICERTLEVVSELDVKINLGGGFDRSLNLGATDVYPFVLPWLPTPVPKP